MNEFNLKHHLPNLPAISKYSRIAFAILIFGFTITAISAFYTYLSANKKGEIEFETICDEIKVKMDSRLHAHALILRSGSALFATKDKVTQPEWKRFIESSKIEKNLPGILGMGFSVIIPKDELLQHIQSKQKEGFPDYTIYPAGDREIYTSIIYLEPFSGRNLRAFGYDMFSEPVRRKAMELSRDNDIAALSGKVLLVQETYKDVQTGTLMYVPVYQYGMPANTVEERRAAIRGWVYSPYRMNDLMQGILGRWDKIQEERIHLQVFDDSLAVSSLLYDSQKNDLLKDNISTSRTLSIPLEFNGKKWVLLFMQPDGLISYFQGKVIIVFICGISLSLLLFLLSLSLLNTRERAQQIAEELTVSLKASEELLRTEKQKLQQAHKIAKLGSWDWDSATDQVNYSDEIHDIFGVERENFKGNFTSIIDTLIHPEDRELVKQTSERAIQIGAGQTVEYRIILHDGEERWIRAIGEFVYEQGTLVRMFGANQDITEYKNIEEKLLNASWRLKNIIEGTNVGTWEWNVQTGETIFNERWAEIIGYTLAELAPFSIKTWETYTHPEDLKKSGELLKRHFAGELPYYDCELRMKHKDGQWIWVHDRGRVKTWTEDGNPLLMFGTHVDINKRKQIEAGLEKTRKELAVIKMAADELSVFAENIIDTVHEPLLALDRDLRIVKASQSFYDFFKVSPEETIGKQIYDLGNHQWNIPKLRELLENILPEKTAFNNYEVEHDFTVIGKRIMRLNARQIKQTSGKEKIILLAI